MDRRRFLSASAAVAGTMATTQNGIAAMLSDLSPAPVGLDTSRHRFGVNYTPSHNWWFCWNDWDADPIKRDLDAIAALGADHLRLMLIWPFFSAQSKMGESNAP